MPQPLPARYAINQDRASCECPECGAALECPVLPDRRQDSTMAPLPERPHAQSTTPSPSQPEKPSDVMTFLDGSEDSSRPDSIAVPAYRCEPAVYTITREKREAPGDAGPEPPQAHSSDPESPPAE